MPLHNFCCGFFLVHSIFYFFVLDWIAEETSFFSRRRKSFHMELWVPFRREGFKKCSQYHENWLNCYYIYFQPPFSRLYLIIPFHQRSKPSGNFFWWKWAFVTICPSQWLSRTYRLGRAGGIKWTKVDCRNTFSLTKHLNSPAFTKQTSVCKTNSFTLFVVLLETMKWGIYRKHCKQCGVENKTLCFATQQGKE